MKKYLLTLMLCAFAVSFSPVASAASDSALAGEGLPFFKKKKGSMARYKQIKRNNGSYVKKRATSTRKKKSFFQSIAAR
ncbi:hypothetical protein ACFSC6_11690 [Rufibacter sediminis]|uniref:Uncharacterized protein n=1 Tax=Rufibacter sediminis TaxID=2762756 RepID=A0ABR6VTL1_9BACT|nr:hypothetical protein [Rufibacter sediminis]MBC3540542.1 hypothetical protein [Rufibacter sediminis]